MDKGHRFLHNHPMTEKRLGLDEQHVIVDRDAWEEARKQVLNLGIPRVSVSLPTPEEIWEKADEMLPTEFVEWYKRNVGYER